MAIVFTPFDELFAPLYQLTYVSTSGYINVGSHTYNVFHNYTMQERQIIFQECEKHLPWKYTREQEQWERTQYVYQFIIKSPPPFPYSEYELNLEIKMLTIEEEKILKLMVAEVKAKIKLNTANVIMGTEIRAEFGEIDTRIREEHEPTITPLQADVKATKDALVAEIDK